MERITKGKANKAAWPGSQLLFDSLRHGITELESKTKELKDARDTVKNVHIAMDKSAWGEACGSILGHWTSTLKTHRSIFQEVVNVTKPLPGAGPTALFNGFSELLKAADDSIDNADDVRKSINVERGTHTSTSSGESDTGSKSESSELPDAPEVTRSASKKRKAEHGGETVSLPLRSPEKPEEIGVKYATEESDEDTTWAHKPAKTNMAPPAFPAQKERKSSTEDITGLVDARLKANEAKRKEKKDRKKRKRDSIASSIFSPAQSENGDAFIKNESEPARASTKNELPPKKKVKLEAGAEGDGSDAEAPKANDKAANKAAAMKAVRKAAKKLKKERAAQGKPAEEKLNFAPPIFDDDGAADLKHYKEADDKGGDVQGKKEKKSKRRRSSDELGEEAQAQDQTHHHGHGKKAKKVKTG